MTAIVIQGDRIILLNADMNELHRITMQKAARLLSLGKAVIVESDPFRKLGEWAYPKIIKLKEFVYIPWEKLNGPPRVSRRRVLIRDNYLCAYCPEKATTIDHIHPRQRGGKNTWENLVAACLKCNHKKANRDLADINMKLLRPGYVPKLSQLRA